MFHSDVDNHSDNGKKKIILFTPVNYDGIGDFIHFVEIHRALDQNPQLKKYEFVSLISCAPCHYERIKSLKRCRWSGLYC